MEKLRGIVVDDRVHNLQVEKVEFEFFHVGPESNNTIGPIPDIGTEILVVIENGNYFHCYVDEEHESYEEGGQSYTAIFTIFNDEYIELSNIKKWSYLKKAGE